jgi:hypothetical protein
MMIPFAPLARLSSRRRPTTAEIARALAWMAQELRAERQFPWYRSRRPRAFVLALPATLN